MINHAPYSKLPQAIFPDDELKPTKVLSGKRRLCLHCGALIYTQVHRNIIEKAILQLFNIPLKKFVCYKCKRKKYMF
jgi:hypothetical protein